MSKYAIVIVCFSISECLKPRSFAHSACMEVYFVCSSPFKASFSVEIYCFCCLDGLLQLLVGANVSFSFNCPQIMSSAFYCKWRIFNSLHKPNSDIIISLSLTFSISYTGCFFTGSNF